MVNQIIALIFGIGVTIGAVIAILLIIRKHGVTRYSTGLLLLTSFWLFWGLRAFDSTFIRYSETTIVVLTYGAALFLLAGLGLLAIELLSRRQTPTET